MKLDIIYNEDCLGMKKLPDKCVDLIATDPPYGIAFMGKQWDKAIPSIDIWREVLRVLKSGALAFVMCIPRQDCLARMIVSLEDAGFNVSFTSIYWAYASGFPKAQNIGKAMDKRLGAEREIIGDRVRLGDKKAYNIHNQEYEGWGLSDVNKLGKVTAPATPQAQALDGSYGGFQPKPAVEVIIVAMKPLSEKTYVDQALKDGKGITWLDDCQIPCQDTRSGGFGKGKRPWERGKVGNNTQYIGSEQGRFPANLLVSDDVLNDKQNHKSGWTNKDRTTDVENYNVDIGGARTGQTGQHYSDSGSFSRYFSLDAWFDKKLSELPTGVQKTFPFLIVPKASKAEKNRGCEGMEDKQILFLRDDGRKEPRPAVSDPRMDRLQKHLPTKNIHPCVKPIKLFSYLITLGSREGDIILDPFIGSGTTAIAARMLGRHYIGFEIDRDYCEIANKRLSKVQLELLN